MRLYAFAGAAIGILYGAVSQWPGTGSPELLWWQFAGYLAGFGIGGALCGAGFRAVRAKMNKQPPR